MRDRSSARMSGWRAMCDRRILFKLQCLVSFSSVDAASSVKREFGSEVLFCERGSEVRVSELSF